MTSKPRASSLRLTAPCQEEETSHHCARHEGSGVPDKHLPLQLSNVPQRIKQISSSFDKPLISCQIAQHMQERHHR